MSDMKNGDVEVGNDVAGKSNKKTIAIIVGAVVAVIALIIIIVAIFGGGYKSPIKNYYAGIQKVNSKTYLKSFPEFMKDDLEDEYDDEYLEDAKEDKEKTYGDKLKMSVKFISKIKINKDDLKDVQDALKKKYDDEKIKVQAGYEVVYELKTKGSDEKSKHFHIEEVYKINGKWCQIPYSSLY